MGIQRNTKGDTGQYKDKTNTKEYIIMRQGNAGSKLKKIISTFEVNLIPVLAKADCLTKAEVKKKKEKIMKELTEAEIEIYQFPDCDSDEDDDFKEQNEN